VNPHFWWYVARASGIVAWLMLTASVVWGVLLSTKAFPRHRRPAWLLDLHRFLGGLAATFVAFHLAALVADSYTHFGVADLAVPFASKWRPGAVALGIVALWLLVSIELTSVAMRRIPRRVWRRFHLSSYAVFWLASLHALLAGTDHTQPLYRSTAIIAIGAVAVALVYRLARPPAPLSTRNPGDPSRTAGRTAKEHQWN
jgi:methionine sulfoxide reductase heme-binding subunit